jgi:hypothetical protein
VSLLWLLWLLDRVCVVALSVQGLALVCVCVWRGGPLLSVHYTWCKQSHLHKRLTCCWPWRKL